MMISSILFLHFIFLGLFNGCLPSNPVAVMVQSPEDNEEGNGKIQTEDLATDSEIVIVQSQEDNSDKTGKMQTEDLSINSKSVMIQSQEAISEKIYKIGKEVRSSDLGSVTGQDEEDNNLGTVQMQVRDTSTDPESVTVNSQEYNNEKTGKIQMDDFSTDPEIEMVNSQRDKYGRIGKLQSESNPDEESAQVPRVIAVRFKCPFPFPACNQGEETEAVYEATSNNGTNATPFQMEGFSTNPDSVMLLRQVDKNRRIAGSGRIDKIGRIRSEDNQEEESFEVPQFISVRWCPFNDRRCNQGEEREVHYQKTPNRNPNVTPFPDVGRNTRTYPPYSIRPIQRRTTIRYNTSQMPPINGNNNNNRGNSRPDNMPPYSTTEPEEDIAKPENAATRPPNRKPRTGAGLFASLVNDFTFKLAENLNLESNFVISPLSIFVALSMCYLGSDGKTKAQLEQAFGGRDYEIHDERLHQGIDDLLSQVMKDSGGYELFVANGMFLGNNFTADAQFENDIRRYYQGEVRNLDFVNPESIRFINGWVAENTRNMITSIINRPPDILTRLILLNAVFFKGIWKMQFPQRLTYDGKFHLLNGDEKQVQFMRLLDETFPVFRSDQHKHTFVKLPYDGEEVSMIIALPHIERQKPMPTITDAILHYDVRERLTNTELGTIAMPKFQLEYQTTLKRPLQLLGITDIFDANVADLSKIRREKDLYLSKIIHKAVVDVNEVGTTASAITSDFVGLGYRNKTNFIANHPFAFYIVHEATGLVLFYGKVYDFDSEASGSNDRRGNPRPIGESPSNDRREDTRNRPQPMQGDGSYNVRDTPSERRPPPNRARPSEMNDANNRRQNYRPRFQPRPLSDSYNRGQNTGSRYRPESSDLNDQRENERTGYEPAETSNSNTRRNNRPPPRPAGGSDFDMYG